MNLTLTIVVITTERWTGSLAMGLGNGRTSQDASSAAKKNQTTVLTDPMDDDMWDETSKPGFVKFTRTMSLDFMSGRAAYYYSLANAPGIDDVSKGSGFTDDLLIILGLPECGKLVITSTPTGAGFTIE